MTPSNPAGSEYQQVADLLRNAISAGTYPHGSQLPTEDELAARMGVNRATVNRALRMLGAEGLVRVHRGKGTFVTDMPPILRIAARRYGRAARERDGAHGAFDAEVRAMGMEPHTDVTITRDQAPVALAEYLGAQECVVRGRRMFAGEVPVQLATSYIPAAIAAGTAIEEEDSGPGGIISRLAELGQPQAIITEQITVRPPSEVEALALGMSVEQRVYFITHIGRTASGEVVEVCVHVMPTHRWTLQFDWAVG